MVQSYYHATSLEAAEKIKSEGLKPIWDYVYLTDTLESAKNWMGFRFQAMGAKGFAIIEVKMDSARLKEGYDHSPLMQVIFGAGASLIYNRRIPPNKIVNIHYYTFDHEQK